MVEDTTNGKCSRRGREHQLPRNLQPLKNLYLSPGRRAPHLRPHIHRPPPAPHPPLPPPPPSSPPPPPPQPSPPTTNPLPPNHQPPTFLHTNNDANRRGEEGRGGAWSRTPAHEKCSRLRGTVRLQVSVCMSPELAAGMLDSTLVVTSCSPTQPVTTVTHQPGHRCGWYRT